LENETTIAAIFVFVMPDLIGLPGDFSAGSYAPWIPGLRYASPGMTQKKPSHPVYSHVFIFTLAALLKTIITKIICLVVV